jgi:O-antigen ligase
VMVLLPGAFLLTANSISKIRWLKLLCWLMISIGALSLAAYFLHIEIPFLNTGGLFSLWFVSLTYAQTLFNRKLPSWLRLVLLGLVGSWVYIYFIIHVTWLSGWLPPLIALGTITFLKSKRLFLIFVLLLVIYVGLNWDYYAGTVLTAEAGESGYTRLAAWKQNWQVTGKHLLFGTGPAGYAAYYMSYFPTKAMATHSNYIDILSQTGIVGLFFCLWFFGALGWTGYKLSLRLKGSADFSEGFAAATLAGWVGCILAMGLGDWLFPFVYTQTIAGFDYAVYSWILLGGMVALSNMYKPGEVVDA